MCQRYGCLLQGKDGLNVVQVADGLSVLPLIMLFHHPSRLNVQTRQCDSSRTCVPAGWVISWGFFLLLLLGKSIVLGDCMLVKSNSVIASLHYPRIGFCQSE